MIRVNVALPSRRNESLSVHLSSSVKDLRILAQKSFGQSFLKLITPEGHALVDSLGSLQTAGIQDGDHLIAIALQARVAATSKAFALFGYGGDKIITWGHPSCGGDFPGLPGIQQLQAVQASAAAFAAVLADGSVATWGDPRHGGRSWAVQDRLRSVREIQANFHAFAAILLDGSVVTWGNETRGGNSSFVRDQLKGVQQVQAT